MISDGHFKYFWYNEGDIEQLFDLERDPREQHNLAQDPNNKKLVGEWRERLIGVLEEERSPDVKDGKLVSVPYPEIDEKKLRSRNIFNPRGMHY